MFVQEQVRKNLQHSKEENKKMIDHRNIELVQHLRSTDSAFSLGEGREYQYISSIKLRCNA